MDNHKISETHNSQGDKNIQPTTADLLTKQLLEKDIRTIFALPGVQNDHLFDAFYRAESPLKIIHTRHEQGAAYMALGASMATGEASAFVVAPGPGVLNTTAALCTADACNAPVICITGQIPSSLIGKGYGILHELPDQLGTMQSITRWASRIDRPDEAEISVDEAFDNATQGRPGPVALECAMDIWSKRLDEDDVSGQKDCTGIEQPMAAEQLANAAAGLLRAAKRPLIIVGGGAQHASKEVIELAELLSAPVVAHRMGHGIIDTRHPLAANIVSGADHWANADVVIGIGTRLQLQQMGWGIDDDLKVIRIEIDPEEMNRFRAPDIGLLGDAQLETARILKLLGSDKKTSPDRAEEIANVREKAEQQVSFLEPQISFLNAIREVLPETGIFVDELTQLGYVSRLTFPVYHPRTYLSPGYQGTLGWGLPVAMGAKVACPEKPVVAVSGDGGFMFNVQELATAVQHKISVAVVLVDDGAFGNVRRTQEEDFSGRVIASELQNPDFVALAKEFGARGTKATTPDELKQALTEAFKHELPTVIVVPAQSMPSPWEFLRPKKRR